MSRADNEMRDEILAKSAWATMEGALAAHMPQRLREDIGSKAIAGASYVSQLETINTSRAARGVKPLSMTYFMAGFDPEEE